MNRSTKTLYVYMTVCYMKNNYVMLFAAISPSVCPITAFDRNSHLRRSVCDQLRVLLAREGGRETERKPRLHESRTPHAAAFRRGFGGLSLSLSLTLSLSLSVSLSLSYFPLLFSVCHAPHSSLFPSSRFSAMSGRSSLLGFLARVTRGSPLKMK